MLCKNLETEIFALTLLRGSGGAIYILKGLTRVFSDICSHDFGQDCSLKLKNTIQCKTFRHFVLDLISEHLYNFVIV